MVVAVRDEIAFALKLETLLRGSVHQGGFDPGLLDTVQRVGIQMIGKLPFCPVRRFIVKQAIVYPNLRPGTVAGRHPLDHALGLDAVFRIFADGIGDGVGAHLNDIARLVLNRLIRLDHIGVAQAHALAQYQALVFLVGLLAEVIGVDIDLTAKGQLALPQVLPGGMVGSRQHLHLVLGIIGEHDLKRIQHRHGARCVLVQVFTDSKLQHSHIHHTVGTGGAYHVAKFANGGRGVTAATHAGYGGHAGVVPTGNNAVVHQLFQFALAGNRVTGVQPTEFILPGATLHWQVLDKPVVQGLVIFELQGANGVGNALNGIFLAVGEVIGGINHPVGTGLVMSHLANTVQDRVAHIHIG